MAAGIFGGPLAVTNTATSIHSLLSLVDRKYPSTIVLRADPANAQTIWIGKSNVTTAANQLSFLAPGEALVVDISGYGDLQEIYLIASANSTAYIFGVV